MSTDNLFISHPEYHGAGRGEILKLDSGSLIETGFQSDLNTLFGEEVKCGSIFEFNGKLMTIVRSFDSGFIPIIGGNLLGTQGPLGIAVPFYEIPARSIIQLDWKSGDYFDGAGTFQQIAMDTSTIFPTKLLLHFDGVDGATETEDASPGGHAITFNGDAQLDTAQKKFGESALLLDGAGDYLSIPDSADWDFGTGDLTVDLWVRFNSLSDTQTIISESVVGDIFSIAHQFPSTQWSIRIAGVDNKIADADISVDVWYHIAVVRSGTTVTFYKDGVSLGSFTNGGDVQGSAGFSIGVWYDPVDYFDGWMDEFRVSKGVARWIENFTPPSAPYVAELEPALPLPSEFLVTPGDPIKVLFNWTEDPVTVYIYTPDDDCSDNTGVQTYDFQQIGSIVEILNEDFETGWGRQFAYTPELDEDFEDPFWDPAYGADVCVGGTAIFEEEYEGSYPASNAFDDNISTRYINGIGENRLGYLGYDLGVSNEKTVVKYRYYCDDNGASPRTWTFEGSNTGAWGGEEVVLDTQTDIAPEVAWKEFTFINTTAYRYYRMNWTVNNGDANYTKFQEMEMMEVI